MNKASIGKSLIGGSAKQRAIIMSNHIAAVSTGGKPLLSDSEYSMLVDSFKSDKDIAIYNRYRKMFDMVRFYLSTLIQWRHSYEEALGRLDKFITLRKNNEDMEELVNLLLDFIPDKKSREKAQKKVKADFINPAFYRYIEQDKEGYLRVSGGNLIDSTIEDLQERVKSEQVRLKTAIQVVKDYLKESGYNVSIYWAIIKDAENWAKSKKGKELSLIFGPKNRGEQSPPVKRLLGRYTLEDEWETVEVDQELYEKYRQEYLNG